MMQTMVGWHGRFLWYELATTDAAAAKAFYAGVVGWGTQDASTPGAAYTLFTAGEVAVAGHNGRAAALDGLCRRRRRRRCDRST
jgi:predicted enzyme related to lactoylglutathione lyase